MVVDAHSKTIPIPISITLLSSHPHNTKPCSVGGTKLGVHRTALWGMKYICKATATAINDGFLKWGYPQLSSI